MNRFKFITLGITAAFLLNSCSKVLEPVSFFGGKQDITAEAGQEEFEINIKSLTFDTAKKANNATYPRHLILTGNGSKANVSDETIFLKSSFPKPSNNTDYLLGVGDEISFSQLNEFETGIVQLMGNILQHYLFEGHSRRTVAQQATRRLLRELSAPSDETLPS